MVDRCVGVVPVLYRKDDLAPDLFSRYWREIHGVFVANIEGPSQYRQLHLAHLDPGFWENEAVSREFPADQQLAGIAEFKFPDSNRRNAWLGAVGKFAYTDDGNLFRRSASYLVGDSGFHCAKGPANGPREDERSFRLLAMLKAANSHSGEFREYLLTGFDGLCAESPMVLDMQVTILDPQQLPEEDFGRSMKVGRVLSADERYQAIVELVFDGETGWRSFFAEGFKRAQRQFVAHVRQVHAYRVAGVYTLIDDSKLTLSGWLGHDRAQLVSDVGAENILAALEDANATRIAKAS
jgi:hypothetical protein